MAARKSLLADALREALATIDPNELKSQIRAYVPADVQRILAAAGIRDEFVFPTPTVLEARPTLIGYYRLLLGASQKSFYASGSGRGIFKSMEERNVIRAAQKGSLRELCKMMSQALSELVRQMSPAITQRDVTELPLLTIGSQFQGGNNVAIGRRAVEAVYLSVREVVKAGIEREQRNTIVVRNSSGRIVTLVFGSDPDIRIQEELGP